MANAFVRVPPDSTGKRIDSISLDDEGVPVYRQIVAIAGSTSAIVAGVTNASAGATDYGLVVRPTTATVVIAAGGSIGVGSFGAAVAISGSVLAAVTGSVGINSFGAAVAISGTATVAGNVNISATAIVTGSGLGIGSIVAVTVNSHLVSITGTAIVALAAGTANIGFLDSISRTVTTVASGVFDSSAGSTTLVRVGDSANSALRVNVVAGSSGGVSHTDKGSFTAAQAAFVPIGGIFGDAYTTLTASQAGAVRLTSARAMHVNLRDSAGNELSAGTATVVGNVSLAAGTANIGLLDSISRTVQVAVGTPFIIQGISTTVTVAGVVSLTAATTIGINSISATVTVAGSIGIGSIGAAIAISGTATVQLAAPAVPSASRGPKCVTASTSANVTLIASPGTGANIRIVMLSMHNASGTFTSLRVGTSASVQAIVVPAASSGGGAVFTFNPPWVLSASEAAVCSVKPNANYGVFNVHYYVV